MIFNPMKKNYQKELSSCSIIDCLYKLSQVSFKEDLRRTLSILKLKLVSYSQIVLTLSQLTSKLIILISIIENSKYFSVISEKSSKRCKAK